MSTGLTSSRIPWLVGGHRWDPITGCDNGPDVCAVRSNGLCWAENIEREKCKSGANCADCKTTWPAPDGKGEFCATFKPTFHEDRLAAPLRTRTRKVIAVGLGGDMWCRGVRKHEWVRQVFEVMARTDHTYICLTKNPEILFGGGWPADKVKAWWMGASITGRKELGRMSYLFSRTFTVQPKWISFEPLLGPVDMTQCAYGISAAMLKSCGIRFIVIGGLSDGKGKIVREDEGGTRAEWVQPILDAAHRAGISRFLKNFTRSQLRQLVDPRTGQPFESLAQGRDVPPWFAVTD